MCREGTRNAKLVIENKLLLIGLVFKKLDLHILIFIKGYYTEP